MSKKQKILLFLGAFVLTAFIIISYYADICSCNEIRHQFNRFLVNGGRKGLILLSAVFFILFLISAPYKSLHKTLLFFAIVSVALSYIYVSTGLSGSRICREAQKIAYTNNMKIALSLYREDKGYYPDSLEELVNHYTPAIPQQIEFYYREGDSYRIGTTLVCPRNYTLPGDLRPNDPVYEVGPSS